MRKEAGFEVTDRINIVFTTDSNEVRKAFNNGTNLKSVVLADSIEEGTADGFSKELDVNGEKALVTICKVK